MNEEDYIDQNIIDKLGAPHEEQLIEENKDVAVVPKDEVAIPNSQPAYNNNFQGNLQQVFDKVQGEANIIVANDDTVKQTAIDSTKNILKSGYESQETKAIAEKDVQTTLSQKDKEDAYFERHKNTLAIYKVKEACSMSKMRFMVALDLIALFICAPFLFLIAIIEKICKGVASITKGMWILIGSVGGIVLLYFIVKFIWGLAQAAGIS